MTTLAFKLTIAYDGSNYSGWQKQKNAKTIQEEIETRLAIITDSPVTLHGAGRTDAGVHAKAMTAHFHTDKKRTTKSIQNGLNTRAKYNHPPNDCTPSTSLSR